MNELIKPCYEIFIASTVYGFGIGSVLLIISLTVSGILKILKKA